MVRNRSWIATLGLVLALTVVLGSAPPPASAAETRQSARAMLVLDASGSMWGKIGGRSKIAIAREVVGDLMRNWDPSVSVGLSAYGHRRKGDCSDIEQLVPIGTSSPEAIAQMVTRINPRGKTPLSQSVRLAAEALRYTEEAATVILVTDGLETCDADPCELAALLEETGVDFTAHVVGFDIAEAQSSGVRCIAEKTGGQYFAASNADELKSALATAVKETAASGRDRVRLALAEGGPLLEGEYGDAEFSFFALDDAGQASPATAAHNYGHVGFLDVPAGKYLARVEFGTVTAEQTLEVLNERAEHVIVLDAAIIRLNALFSKETKADRNNLAWEVLAASDARRVTYDHGQQVTFVLSPGDYRVTAAVSGVRKAIDLQLAAGDIIEREVDLRGGTLAFRPVLSARGEPAPGYFHWQAFSLAQDGKSRGERLDYSNQNSGQFVLPAGRNLLVFEAYAIKRELVLDIVAEQTVNLDLDLNGALLNYEFVDADGKRLPGYPTWNLFRAGAESDPANRLTYDHKSAGSIIVPAGEPLVLTLEADGRNQSWPIDSKPGETRDVRFEVGR